MSLLRHLGHRLKMLYFFWFSSALDAEEHAEIPSDTASWLANIACKCLSASMLQFYHENPYK